MAADRRAFRTDILALRGLAVVLVILQPARAGFVGVGWLGVDIFFVISGFLIAGLLAGDIGQGRFRFAKFHFRRAKRRLPAAYATFAATAATAFFLLDASEWRDFTAQLAGAVSFTGNFVLPQQTGYFAGAATLKPLLHVWSLAVEEQYYLLLPGRCCRCRGAGGSPAAPAGAGRQLRAVRRAGPFAARSGVLPAARAPGSWRSARSRRWRRRLGRTGVRGWRGCSCPRSRPCSWCRCGRCPHPVPSTSRSSAWRPWW